jgi:hypothetical protein
MDGRQIDRLLFGCLLQWEDMINRHRQAAPTEHLIVTGWVEYAKLTLKSCMHARMQKIIEPLFSSLNSPQISLCKKKILCHIKMSANTWSTKCWWNQKLIAQFCCTLRDEHFKPS